MKVGLIQQESLEHALPPCPQHSGTDAMPTVSTIELIQLTCSKLLYVLGTESATSHYYVYCRSQRAYCVQYQSIPRYCIIYNPPKQQLSQCHSQEATKQPIGPH